MHNIVKDVLVALRGHSIIHVLGILLSDSYFTTCATRIEFVHDWPDLLKFAIDTEVLQQETTTFCSQVHTKALASEIANLANKQSGWHFSARKARAEQVETFSLSDMARTLEVKAPHTWDLLGTLLQSDASRSRKRMQYLGISESSLAARPQHPTDDSDVERDNWDDEDEYWEALGVVIEDGMVTESGTGTDTTDRPSKHRRHAGECFVTLMQIVSTFSGETDV